MERFRRMQQKEFNDAYKEIYNGKKESHWIWYIFPQIKGLGHSFMCEIFDIKSLEEAKEYLNDNYLCKNLIKICEALLHHVGKKNIKEIMSIDDIKVLSCMTLFNIADENKKCNGIFKMIIDKFYDGKQDEKTIEIINKQKEEKRVKNNNLKNENKIIQEFKNNVDKKGNDIKKNENIDCTPMEEENKIEIRNSKEENKEDI